MVFDKNSLWNKLNVLKRKLFVKSKITAKLLPGKNDMVVSGGPSPESPQRLGSVSCQDVSLPKGLNLKNKPVPRIRSVYDGLKCCMGVKSRKMENSGGKP
jgi:hypothetical protein